MTPKQFKEIAKRKLTRCKRCKDPARGEFCEKCKAYLDDIIVCFNCNKKIRRGDICTCIPYRNEMLGIDAFELLDVLTYTSTNYNTWCRKDSIQILQQYGFVLIDGKDVTPNIKAIETFFNGRGLFLDARSLRILAEARFPTCAANVRRQFDCKYQRYVISETLKKACEWGLLKLVERPESSPKPCLWYDKVRFKL